MAQKRALQLYTAAVNVSGIAVLIAFLFLFPIRNVFSAVFFALLAFVAETQTAFVGNGKSLSVSSSAVTAAMLTSGPAAAVLIAVACVMGSISKIDGKIKHVFNTNIKFTLFNIGNYALSIAVMCLVYFRFGGVMLEGPYNSFLQVFRKLNPCSVPLIIGVVLCVTCNLLLVGIFISTKNQISFFRIVAPEMAWPFSSIIIFGILGVFLTALYVVYGWFLVVLFFLPFILARYAFTAYKDLQQNYLQTVESLASAIEAKDEYTSGHSRRVEQYSAMIADELKLSGRRRETLRYAALLHDIGKIGIPERILNKNGKLDENEWEYVKSHPEKGAHIVEDIAFLKDAVEIIRRHHEWYNGGGYPGGLSAKELPLEAMIICVADAYDAMTSDRPYRGKLSGAQAMKELHDKAGIQFAPELVTALERALVKKGELPAAAPKHVGTGELQARS